ncbi:alpha/beta fold hydrolase [Actinokineospora soli]|uniref:Alpha/beta fold hydrolase n=1 Tax=Actinokineospora soli TaxID=1048753 RepID=A0ABW2TIJ6_9PSEU
MDCRWAASSSWSSTCCTPTGSGDGPRRHHAAPGDRGVAPQPARHGRPARPRGHAGLRRRGHLEDGVPGQPGGRRRRPADDGRRPAAGAAAAQRGRADRPDYIPSLRAATVPALVVVGSDDEFTPVPVARETAEALPNGRLLVVEGAAHMPNLERPEVFNAALAEFLETVPR